MPRLLVLMMLLFGSVQAKHLDQNHKHFDHVCELKLGSTGTSFLPFNEQVWGEPYVKALLIEYGVPYHKAGPEGCPSGGLRLVFALFCLPASDLNIFGLQVPTAENRDLEGVVFVHTQLQVIALQHADLFDAEVWRLFTPIGVWDAAQLQDRLSRDIEGYVESFGRAWKETHP